MLDARVGPGTANFVHEPAMTGDQLQDALAAGHDAAGPRSTARGCSSAAKWASATPPAPPLSPVRCSVCPPHNSRSRHRAGRRRRQPQGAGHRAGAGPLSPLAPATRSPCNGWAGSRSPHWRAPIYVAPNWACRRWVDELHHHCRRPGRGAAAAGFGALAHFYAHCSAEPGHRRLLDALGAKPLLDLGMRLGEGSGAAVAVPILRAAAALHAGMATFTEAGVS